MHPEERLIGFDARKSGVDFRTWWDQKRCATFLLRDDVRRILSTDDFVWPSVFALDLHDTALSTETRAMFSGPKAPDKWLGPNDPYWEDLPSLNEILAELNEKVHKPYCIIAITFIDTRIPDDRVFGFPSPIAAEIDSGWQLLGYDVSDDRLSGLANCGYRPEDFAQTSRDYWSARLNENHLFTSAEDADEFRCWSDQRIPEHAHFLVYGLYLVEEVLT